MSTTEGRRAVEAVRPVGAVRSMTGLAQVAGDSGASRWTWEFKSVNAKGLDVRLRVPPGFDAFEIEARRSIGTRLARGTCHASLTITREKLPVQLRVDTERLAAITQALAAVPPTPGIGPATLDGLLALPGMIETLDRMPDPAAADALKAACTAGLDAALDALVAMREVEGAALRNVLDTRLDAIGRLTTAADEAPQRTPEAVRAKLAATIATLAERHALDPDRLHQEALILAAKADVREELDRLQAHVAAAHQLLAQGGPIGRRLDFLAQEMGREASTFCAKVDDAALTAMGLELRVEIEQLREQVQNIE